jgi:hypothetical protein
MRAKPLIIGGIVIACLIALSMSFGINSNGYRTVVQLPNGTTYVKATPGPYLLAFGTAETYPDFITFDFDKSASNDDSRSVNQSGINVRYQEGGTGTVYGQVRFALPASDTDMLALHKAYRSAAGVTYKLIKPSVEEVQNLTANLMTSDESYMEKRSMYGEWARDQLVKGKYRTKLESKQVKEETAIAGTADAEQTVWKEVPVILKGADGLPQHMPSDLKTYSVALSSLQITDWDYEQKTIDQIQKRREANMAIITAKADAERAKQDAITTQENGKRDVMKAKYEEEVEKEKAIVKATREAQVAVIAATKTVDVAKQERERQEQNKLAMIEYKQAEVLRGEGDAAYKKAVIEADGALTQKLEAYVTVNKNYADAFGQQKLVPDIVMGGTGVSTAGPEASNLINLLTAKTAKDLQFDANVKVGDKK